MKASVSGASLYSTAMTEKKKYTTCILETTPLKSEELQSGGHDDEMKRRIALCIEVEGPITRALLQKRVLNSFGLFRAGWRLEDHFDEVLNSFSRQLEVEEGVEVYHPASGHAAPFFRPSTKDIRFSHQIPPSEGAAAIKAALEEDGGRLKKAELYRCFLVQLGYSKSGSDLQQLFNKSLAYAVSKGLIKRTSKGLLTVQGL